MSNHAEKFNEMIKITIAIKQGRFLLTFAKNFLWVGN